jgi:hypothetical protein
MQKDTPSNHGEGNPEAADRFNTAEQAFVGSPRGKQAIAKGTRVSPDQEADLAEAEQTARSHAKDDDSDTTAMGGRSPQK